MNLWFALPAHSGFDEGMKAYNLGNFAAALEEWRPLALTGHAPAQFNLGVMYANGQGVPQDYKVAVEWFGKAAQQGHTSAQNNLGVMYEDGLGVPQDYKTAVEWYGKAARQGLALAQNNLGVMYDNGRGVPQLRVVAYALFNLSAAGDPSENNAASKNREGLLETMSRAEIQAGQDLTQELSKPGNFLHALETYVRKPTVKERAAVEPLGDGIAKPQTAPDPYPARPAKRRGVVSCNTRCVNADCWRTYDDGKKVRFTAKRRWDSLKNEFVWDSGSC